MGTAYRHFGSVEELEETLAWNRFDEFSDLVKSADPAAIQLALQRYLELLLNDEMFERVTTRSEVVLDRTREMRSALMDDLGMLLQRAQQLSHTRADVDAADVMGLMCGLAYTVRHAGTAGTPRMRRQLSVVFEGLSA